VGEKSMFGGDSNQNLLRWSPFFNVVQTIFTSKSESLLAPKIPSQLFSKKEKPLHANFLAYLTFCFYSKLHQEFRGYVCTV
jgi:hypothetical protein